MPRLIGPGLAAEMIYTGRQVPADEAHRIGLVNAVHPLDKLMPAAREMAMQNARFFKAATLSTDHSPDIDKRKVSRLEVPVLLINGEKTGAMTRAIVEEFAKVMPTAERVEIKGAGHGSPREKPVEFITAVADFMRRRATDRDK